MKVGDKVYCHKTLEPHFYFGKLYDIIKIDNISISVMISRKNRCRTIMIFAKEKIGKRQTIFKDYFYTIKEYRKIKLERIQKEYERKR